MGTPSNAATRPTPAATAAMHLAPAPAPAAGVVKGRAGGGGAAAAPPRSVPGKGRRPRAGPTGGVEGGGSVLLRELWASVQQDGGMPLGPGEFGPERLRPDRIMASNSSCRASRLGQCCALDR